MSTLNKAGSLLAGACLIAFASMQAAAQTTTTTTTPTTTTTTTSTSTPPSVPTAKLVSQYTTLAGSTANAESLVKGLSTGSTVTLKSASTSTTTGTTSGTTGTTSGSTGTTSGTGTSTNTGTVTFTPPTGKMGTGNVNIALALAQKSLADQGITEPTAQQLQTALMGGSLSGTGTKSTQMQGVLQMRADGMGWGVIAKELGFKLGDAMRSSNAQAQRPATAERGGSAQVAKVDRADKPQRAERAERVDRPQKIERPERVERVERVERPVRPERPERVGR